MKRAPSAEPLLTTVGVGAQSCCAQGGVRSGRAQQDCAPTTTAEKGGRVLLLGVLLTFVLLAVAYFAVFKAAREAQIREVPLATKGGRP